MRLICVVLITEAAGSIEVIQGQQMDRTTIMSMINGGSVGGGGGGEGEAQHHHHHQHHPHASAEADTDGPPSQVSVYT